MRDPIVIADYDPGWPAIFERERDVLKSYLGDLVVEIEHIGSTAVPSLGAKPIIDIMPGVVSLDNADKCVPILEAHGYNYKPHLEESFPRRRYLNKLENGIRKVHIHIVETDSDFWRDHLLYRDYLRDHPDVAQKYLELKRELAEEYREDWDSYCDSKSEFINSIMEIARRG